MGEGSPETEAVAQEAGHALFSPFATVGLVVQPPPAASVPDTEGNWSLPVSATVAGLVALGWMVRFILH